MEEQQRQSTLAILKAAHHNAKMVQDQLESLVNPKDFSFKDYPMPNTVTQIREAVEAIRVAIVEVERGQDN